MLSIELERWGRIYLAKVDGQEFTGASPDEALGCAVREMILQNYGQEMTGGGTVLTLNVHLLQDG